MRLQVHEPQTVSSAPGTVHTALHHCVPHPPPTAAPWGAGSARTGPVHGKNQSPRPPYHESPAPEK